MYCENQHIMIQTHAYETSLTFKKIKIQTVIKILVIIYFNMYFNLYNCSKTWFIWLGLNPFATEGRNIAVISASMVSDSENTRTDTSHGTSGFVIMGHNRSMVSNRISYSFNLTGKTLFLLQMYFTDLISVKIPSPLHYATIEGVVWDCSKGMS